MVPEAPSNISTLQTLQRPSKPLFGECHNLTIHPPNIPPFRGVLEVGEWRMLHSPATLQRKTPQSRLHGRKDTPNGAQIEYL